jgi:hypothetical protein
MESPNMWGLGGFLLSKTLSINVTEWVETEFVVQNRSLYGTSKGDSSSPRGVHCSHLLYLLLEGLLYQRDPGSTLYSCAPYETTKSSEPLNIHLKIFYSSFSYEPMYLKSQDYEIHLY